MTVHLSPEIIDRLRLKQVSPADRVAADLHVAECAECRAALSPAVRQSKQVSLVAALQRHGSRHLSYESMKSFLDGELAAGECSELGSHVGECNECARLLEDLRQFTQSIDAVQVVAVKPSVGQRLAAWLRTGPGMLAVATVAIALLVTLPSMHESGPRTTAAHLDVKKIEGIDEALARIPNQAFRERVQSVLNGKTVPTEAPQDNAAELANLFPGQRLIRGAIFQAAGNNREAATEYKAEIDSGSQRARAAGLLQSLPGLQ